MDIPNYGVHLHEIELIKYKGFYFKLPTCETEGLKAYVYVNYFRLKNNMVFYQAWVRFEEIPYMLELVEKEISPSTELDSQIITDINLDPHFREQLNAAIKWFRSSESE